jgi:hypothetical protein
MWTPCPSSARAQSKPLAPDTRPVGRQARGATSSGPRPCGYDVARRQLNLPHVLPHAGMLPHCLIRVVPAASNVYPLCVYPLRSDTGSQNTADPVLMPFERAGSTGPRVRAQARSARMWGGEPVRSKTTAQDASGTANVSSIDLWVLSLCDADESSAGCRAISTRLS